MVTSVLSILSFERYLLKQIGPQIYMQMMFEESHLQVDNVESCNLSVRAINIDDEKVSWEL